MVSNTPRTATQFTAIVTRWLRLVRESWARPQTERAATFSCKTTGYCTLCVCVCLCTYGIAFSAESVVLISMQLIVLWLCQPKAVKNTQPYQMRCNLFVSLQACKVEPCEAKTYISWRLFSFLSSFENNWKSQYSSYHISNIITSFGHCFLVWCGPMYFSCIKRLSKHE